MSTFTENVDPLDAIWENLEVETLAPSDVARATLMRIINENKDTSFGKEHSFHTITPENFKERLVLAKFSNFESYIDRTVAGEDNVLSARDVDFFMTTSGTTGKSKLIPGGIGNHESMGRLSFLQEHFDNTGKMGEATLLLVNKPPIRYDSTSRHRMIGPFTSIIVQKTVEEAERDPSSWKSLTPPHIHLLENYDDFSYIAALYALKNPHLKVMRTTFLPNLLSFFHTLHSKWKEIVHDIRLGIVSPPIVGLDEHIVRDLKASMKPNQARADELELMFSSGNQEGLIARLWPQLTMVACITGGTFNMYVPRLKSWIGDKVIVYSPFMIGSEGFYGTNYSPGEHESLYHPTVRLNYFEFIQEKDVDSLNPITLDLEELTVGGRYEMVVTNNGLYRFRMGDVIEIKSFHNKMPLFDMCYRLGSVINMVGEKTSEGHLMSVLQSMDRATDEESKNESEISHEQEPKGRLIDFTTSVEISGAAPQYVVYVELEQSTAATGSDSQATSLSWSSQKFDHLLCLANDQYGLFRSQGRLLEAEVRLVTRGLSAALCHLAKATGTSEVQFKVPRLLTTAAQMKAMNDKVIKTAVPH
jgi:GH3 auxin-responsive promoter